MKKFSAILVVLFLVGLTTFAWAEGAVEVPGEPQFNMQYEVIQFLMTIIWALVGAVAMGISLGILIKFFDWMTPVNEWNQVRDGNIAMGLILAAVILGFAQVIAAVVQ